MDLKRSPLISNLSAISLNFLTHPFLEPPLNDVFLIHKKEKRFEQESQIMMEINRNSSCR